MDLYSSGGWQLRMMAWPKRFSELKRNIPYASAKVLTENLRFMVEEGMILREVRGEHTVEVWYHLTGRGKDLGRVIKAMNSWGEKWLQVPVDSEAADGKESDARSKRASVPLATQW